MSPVKSALAGLAVGLIAYFVVGNVGAIFPSRGDSTLALIDTEVSPSLAPGASEVPNRGTNLAPGAKTMAPGLAPTVTSVAPSSIVSVTPRISAPVTPTVSPTVPVTPHPSVTPNPTPTPSSPTPSPTPTPTPSATAMPSVTPTPTPPIGTSRVVINEIAWAGTAFNASDEWIELYNAGDGNQALDGWTLCDAGGAIVTFSALHSIEIGQFFLVERGDDQTISDIQASFAHSFGSGGLNNSGEHLTLRSGSCTDGASIDEVGPGVWHAGSASPDYASMERVDPLVPGSDLSNWASNSWLITTGLDAAGNPVRGTPMYKNSVSP